MILSPQVILLEERLRQRQYMSPIRSVAASLSPEIRQDIGIQVLSRSQPISQLAAAHQVSRKFIYQQGDKAQRSLDGFFCITPQKGIVHHRTSETHSQ